MTLYLSASNVTLVSLIKDCKFDIWMMSINNETCQKAMKGNFFQKNHVESDCEKDVPTPFLSKNGWIIHHLSALILQNIASCKTNIENKNWIFPYFNHLLNKKFILWYSTTSESLIISQSIFPKIFQKNYLEKNAISQDLWFFSISLLMQLCRRKGIENPWKEKCLQAEIKTSFFVVFNGFHLNNLEKIAQGFLENKKFKFKKL